MGRRSSIADRLTVFAVLVCTLSAGQAIANPETVLSRLPTDAVFVLALLALTEIYDLAQATKWWHAALPLAATLAAGGLYLMSSNTYAAWLFAMAFLACLAWLDRAGVSILIRRRAVRWSARFILAGTGSFAVIALSQIESRFSDEEFFVFVQGATVALFCAAFLAGYAYLHRLDERGYEHRQARAIGAASVAIYAVFVVGLAMWSIGAYQRSFYSLEVTTFPGVTEDSPFVCGEVAPDDDHPSGQDVYRRLLALVQANPRKSTPEFGMLALSTGELQWAEAFRDSILAEAQSGRFTEPANSVKYGQYEAAIRAYYVPLVQVRYPDLFSADDQLLLLDWFAAINRRALTAEWVDWLYALAFSKQPEGPYENQENGAALLAVLEASGLSPADLSPVNQDYLARNVRGWAQRFRNTDDSYLYQPEWIRNAYFQSLNGDTTPAVDLNRRLSFEWLMLQSLPDGAPFNYNQVARRSIPSEYYLGARLLGDPRYVWLADRALRALEANGGYPAVQPGLEDPASLTGVSPVEGSCLMYGDSGLPNQKGGLAPDKIAFRDGWSPDSTYALLNLRFTGWHRYKATNAVVGLYQDGPLVVEQASAQPFSWLPQGRAAFRDKRVPRENLNGLLVPQSGMSNVLYTLTGIGSGWAQDPPHHARVDTFETLNELDVSRTTIDDWRGWTSSRSIYFFHDGPIVLFDSANKPDGEADAAVTWHVVGAGDRAGDSMWLRADSAPARVVLPADAWSHTSIQSEAGFDATTRGWALTYHSPEPGRLDLVTTFLLNDWAGSQVDSSVVRDNATSQLVGQFLGLRSAAGEISILHNESNGRISAHGLSTSGRAVVVQTGPTGTMKVCHIGTGEFEVPAPRGVTQVVDMAGKRFVQGDDWDLVDGTIRFHESMTRQAGCALLITA